MSSSPPPPSDALDRALLLQLARAEGRRRDALQEAAILVPLLSTLGGDSASARIVDALLRTSLREAEGHADAGGAIQLLLARLRGLEQRIAALEVALSDAGEPDV